MQDFRELQVWRRSHGLTLRIYSLTSNFPSSERFGLTQQIRRSSASIPANIAEGCGRGSSPDFRRFLRIAFGSACETEYHLILARDLRFGRPSDVAELLDEIRQLKRMLASLIKRVSGKMASSQTTI